MNVELRNAKIDDKIVRVASDTENQSVLYILVKESNGAAKLKYFYHGKVDTIPLKSPYEGLTLTSV